MAFEPWICSKTQTPHFVNTGLANATGTAGYWFVKNDAEDGGASKVVWPVTANNSDPDSLAPIIDFCKGVCGTADLDKGTLTYTPFITLGFNVAGEDAYGAPQAGDASEWGGICITYRSDIALYPELSLGDAIDAEIGYALPTRSIPQAKNGTKKCIPWSDFKQPSWYKGATKISGPDAAKQLVSINFKMQASAGKYNFNICAIGPYGEKIEGEELPTGAKSLPTTCPKVLTMHPEISVSAKWSKGDDGYDATITVKDGEKELTEGTDYEIESNVNDATGIVIKTITGKGDYAGSVVKSLVPYIDENGVEQTVTDYTVLTSDVTDYIENGVINLPGGWYVVQGEVKYTSPVVFEGDAHLILADGAKMVIESETTGIIANGNLTIYGQGGQSGILNATGSNYYGIRSEQGNITISGGSVTATGSNYYGISSEQGNITISGGKVEATGNNSGIYSKRNITISGGSVTATGNYGISSGSGDITISGGKVEATGSSNGIYGNNGVTISGGTVKATGDYGIRSKQGNITIRGGTVEATGSNSGIYGRGDVTISDGTVEAKATGEYGTGISGENITISGGSVTAKATGYSGYDIYSSGNITISGGTVEATGDYGIRSYNGNIILGWTNSTDFIKANSYYSKNGVSIVKDKYFKDDDGNLYSGTIDPVSDIAGKTLVPFNGKFLSDVNIAVADIPVQKYADGKPVCPSVVVTDGKDTLTAGTDYTVVCSNNNAVTSATLDEAAIAQITGKGNYAGVIQKRFFIWNNIHDYAAVQVYKDADENTHAEIDGAYDGTDAVAIDEYVENVAVKFNRKFPIGKYSTTVLPFGVNTENVEGLDAVLRYNGIKTVNGESSVRMKVVWATDKWVKRNDLRDKNNNLIQYDHADLTANTPYLVQMNDATLKLKSEAFPLMLEKTAPADVSIDDWTFRGTWQYKKWGPSCSTEGQNCDRETGNAYGFAASSSDDDKINVGDFVRVGEGAWILPMRAYLVSTKILESTSPAQGVRANGNYVKRPSFAQEELPEFMSIVIDVDDEGKETTVIGQFNTRTGEIKMNYDRGKFDLKGRRVNGTNNARGAYYGKKVLKK